MTNKDPYSLLGVTRKASASEIKRAYHKLAKKYHPDMNPGRTDIEQKFKDITAAYDLLSDPAKRARFDSGEIDADGNERGFYRGGAQSGSRSAGQGPFGGGFRSGGFSSQGNINPEDIFAEFFGGGFSKGQQRYSAPKGADVTYEITIPFIEACKGGTKRVTLSGGKTIDVNIPPGTEEDDTLRLRGLGQEGHGGNGDALIKIKIAAHPYFKREGNDLHLDVPISLPEAILGAEIPVPTLDGKVSLKVKKGTSGSTTMRLKGKGVPHKGRKKGAGDMYVRLKIILPDGDRAALEKWAEKISYDPRKKLGW